MKTRSSSRWWLGSCLAAALLGYAALARADVHADRVEAQAAFAEARKLRVEGKRAEALVRFRRAHALAPTPVTRVELARELADAGQLIEAHALAATVSALPVTPTETVKSNVARTDAVAFAASLASRIPALRLAFTPAGVEPSVTIDEKPVDEESLDGEIRVDPGEHRVEARRGDMAAAAVTVRVTEGERRTVELRFPEPLRAPAPPAIHVPPSAAPGAQSGSPTARLSPAPDSGERGGTTAVAPVGFGVGGAALLTGIATGVLAIDQANRLRGACSADGSCPLGAQDLLATHQTVTTVSTLAFSVAGAAAVVGVVALVLDGGSSEPSNARRHAGLHWRW